MFGAFTIRVPADGWKPKGYVAPKIKSKLVSSNHVNVSQAMKTPQFWLLFWVLCLNVTAGIGVLGQASVMIQELFSETSVGKQAAIGAGAAAGFVSLLSLFNMGGRFCGPACPTKLAVKILILFSLCSARCCILPFRRLARAGTRLCLLLDSASSFPCMAAVLQRFRRI